MMPTANHQCLILTVWLSGCSSVPMRPSAPVEAPAEVKAPVSYAACQAEMLVHQCLPPLGPPSSPPAAERQDVLNEHCGVSSVVVECDTNPCIVLVAPEEADTLRECVGDQLMAIAAQASRHDRVPVFWAVPQAYERIGLDHSVVRRAQARFRRLERSADGRSSAVDLTRAETCDELVEAVGCETTPDPKLSVEDVQHYLDDVALAHSTALMACPDLERDLVIDCTELPCVARLAKGADPAACTDELGEWWGGDSWTSNRAAVLPFGWSDQITDHYPIDRPVPHPADSWEALFFSNPRYEGYTLLAGPSTTEAPPMAR